MAKTPVNVNHSAMFIPTVSMDKPSVFAQLCDHDDPLTILINEENEAEYDLDLVTEAKRFDVNRRFKSSDR